MFDTATLHTLDFYFSTYVSINPVGISSLALILLSFERTYYDIQNYFEYYLSNDIICISNISSFTFFTVTKVLLCWFVNSHRTFYNLQCSHRQVCTLEGSLKFGYKLDTSTIKTRNTFLDEVIVWRPLIRGRK